MIRYHSSVCIPYSGKFFLEKYPNNFLPLATPDVDYGRVNLTLDVSLRDSDVGEICFNLTIEDDTVVEAMECLVLVFRLPENAPDMVEIAPGNESTICCILDDDG